MKKNETKSKTGRGGSRIGAGRKPGTPNKITRAFKEAVAAVFEDLGGEKHLLGWAKKNPTEFYKIATRLIPTEIVGNVDHGISPATRKFLERFAPGGGS